MRNNNIPKVRFKQFKGLWNEDKIGNIVSISAGGDIDRFKLKNKGKYPVVANSLTNKGIVGFYDDYKVKSPAVTVTGRGDVGYAVARHENFTPIVRLLTLQSEKIDVDYLENQINSMRILNESTGVPQLTVLRRPCFLRCSQKLDRQFQRFVWKDLRVSGKNLN